MSVPAGVVGGAVAIVAIICATVAVCLGQIDASGYTAIIGAFGGIGAGAGAHAAGVKQGQP